MMNRKKINLYPIPQHCLYCSSKVIYTSNAAIYGKEYGNGKCYKCTSCDAYVGVHNGTRIPLGRLANWKLRHLKKQCHDLFDPIWNQKKKWLQRHAYERLAELLNIPTQECHFGWFDEEQLKQAIQILQHSDW
ncbi:zinc-finger-containing protein [Paenibacillus sp. WLX1005]|uniref:zinc-finger-containing protein n=1 Tax=Paenibacillus sp. WLX1005 TaxID=3243766 RepID=UPI0039844DA7